MTTPPPATTTRQRALGAYGERLAARHLVERGLVVLDRNWRCAAGEIDLVLRDGDVLVACEVKTRTVVDLRQPARGHRRPPAGAAAPTGRCAGSDEHDVHPADVRVDLVAVLRPRRGAVGRRPRPRAGLMAFATTHTVSLHGAVGHLIDVQADVSPGQVAHQCSWVDPTPLSTSRATAVRMAISNTGCDVARHPADDDPAVPGRPAQARHPLRPGDRASLCSARLRRPPAGRADRHPGRSASSP